MILWVDAQLSPALAPWIAAEFGVEAYSLRFLGLRDARDAEQTRNYQSPSFDASYLLALIARYDRS